MSIIDFSSFVAIILAVSLASERLVTIIKTLFPTWLADEQKTDAMEVDLVKDKWRRVTVQLIAFTTAWLTSSFLSGDGFDPIYGYITINDNKIHVAILGLLASGGSTFWNNILGYTKAVKDIKIQQRTIASLKFHKEATLLNKTPLDGGRVAKPMSERNKLL